MRILYLSNKAPFPPKDGGSIATLALVNSFARAGHETTVLAMNTRKHHVTPFEIPEEITSRTILHLAEVPARITFWGALKNFFFSRLPYNAERFIDKNYRKSLEILLMSHHYDVIQLEGLYVTPYIPVIRKYSKSLIVYRSHNIEHQIWQRMVKHAHGVKKLYLQILTRRLRRFEESAINQYDLLVPITARDEMYLNRMGNTKPSLVIPAGVDLSSSKMEELPFEMNLFTIGALDWAPNQEGIEWFLDECFPSVIPQIPHVRFKVAGRNAPDWFVEKLNRSNVDYMGEVEDASLFMQQNGVMVVPLLSGSGMRVKIVEGMSNKKPIVTTTVGCEGIEAENGKHIFITDDPSEFSKYVVTLLNDKELVKTVGEAASQFIFENYDNRQLTRELLSFYTNHLQ